MNQQLSHQKSAGFTLIELVIALSLFAFVLAFVSVGFIQIMRLYQASITNRQTQEIAREVVEDIVREARFAPPESVQITGNSICLEQTSRGQAIEFSVDSSDDLHKKVYKGSNCSGGALGVGVVSDTVITGSTTRVGQVEYQKVTFDHKGTTTTVGLNIDITITTSKTLASDLLTSSGESCKPGVPGAQYCAATTLETAVAFR